MASSTISLINNTFAGIRRKNSSFSSECISCSDCQNVELYYTKLNSGVGIRTAKGNIAVTKKEIENNIVSIVPEDENIIGIFESFMDNDTYFFVYTENQTEGKLYTYNTSAFELELQINGLEVTGKACGESFTQGWLDMFIFSNGANVKYLYCDTEFHTGLQVEVDKLENEKLYTITDRVPAEVSGSANINKGVVSVILEDKEVILTRNQQIDTVIMTSIDDTVTDVNYYGWSTKDGKNYYTTTRANVILVDPDGREVKGLGIKSFDSRIWIFDGKVLWYSQQGDCRVFNYVEVDKITSAGYIEFVKPITAIYPYLGSLAVFHKDSSVLVTLDATTGFKQEEESPGGCASYDSLVFHGTDLYFYDDTKKGVFSFKQIVNGDKTLGENIALDVQDELISINSSDLDSIRALSVVTADRNEVWFLVPIISTYTKDGEEVEASAILIYDYIRGEWVKRKCQKINCLGLFRSKLYSAGKDIYEEYITSTFDGDFIESYYTCSIFNLGEDNTLKITKFPPRATCDGSYKNRFWIKYVKNYNPLKSPKVKEIAGKSYGGIMTWDSGDCWDTDLIYVPNSYNAILKLPSATFKALEITLYTTNASEDFCIKSIEYSKIKVKQV